MANSQNSGIYGLVVAILLAISAGIGYFFWKNTKEMKATQQQEQVLRQKLEGRKLQLENTLDSLSSTYAILRTENENLLGQITKTAALIEQKDRAIEEIKAKRAETLTALEEQVANLEQAKSEYQSVVEILSAENNELKSENQVLKGENKELRVQVASLDHQLEDQIRKAQAAEFKATSFRAEVQRRNDQLTSRARAARELLVSFDLIGVPDDFHGNQTLYMSITNEQGIPVTSENTSSLTVYSPTGPVAIVAQQTKKVALKNVQRLSFNYVFDDRLLAGVYIVTIYCDKGLLGVHSFRLI